MFKCFNQPGFAPKFVLLVALISLTNWLLLPANTTLLIMREGGPIEDTTIVFYYMAMIFLWLFRPATLRFRSALAIHVLLMAMTARELDLHRALTGTSMLKLSFWNDATPVVQKLEALFLLVLVMAALAVLFLQHGRKVVAGLRARAMVPMTISTLFAALVASKVIDRSLGVANEVFGLHSAPWLMALQQSIEEPLEMILPVLVIVAIVQANTQSPQSRTESLSR